MTAGAASPTAPGARLPRRVSVIDDDDDVRRSVEWALRAMGLEVRGYASALQYLQQRDPAAPPPDCLLTDVNMPGMSGVELLETMTEAGTAPVCVVLTVCGDAATAVRAMKAGAFDYLEKPFQLQQLHDAVHKALAHGQKLAARRARQQDARDALATLSPREREIFDRVTGGRMNKSIAAELDLAVRTVEMHRARMMERLDAHNLSDLLMLKWLAED